MTPHDELMALAGKATPGELHASEVDGWWCVSYDLTTPGGAGFAVDGDCWTEADAQFIAAACNFVRSDAFRAMVRDAERYRWLRDSQNCSLSVSHNDHHNMYLSVADTMDDSQGYYNGVPDAERARMIETDTIWTVHVYPNTPVGFNVFHAATLDAAIDAAASGAGEV